MDEWGGAFRPRAGRDKKARVAKSDLDSTGAYLAKLAPKTRKLRKIRLHDKTL